MPRTPHAAAVLLSAALLLAGCGGGPPEAAEPPTAEPSAVPTLTPSGAPTEPAPAVTPLPVGVIPARVSIPAIGLDETLIDLGIASDGTMEVPEDYGAVGWFTGGGRPGGHGPVVIAGHVDSPTGAAVFMRLRDLAPGAQVTVTDVDGGTHTYEVSVVEEHPKAAFPTAAVFGAVPRDELRLITCSGLYDRGADSYVDNRIVYATRVG